MSLGTMPRIYVIRLTTRQTLSDEFPYFFFSFLYFQHVHPVYIINLLRWNDVHVENILSQKLQYSLSFKYI